MDIFENISPENRDAMLECVKAYEKTFEKGEFVLQPDEGAMTIGIVIEGTVNMVTEDIWGNRSLLCILDSGNLIGETFACSQEENYITTFIAASSCSILFMDFGRVIHTCDMRCGFHHRLIENMVKMIALKNFELLKKLDVISKMQIRKKILTFLSQQSAEKGSETFDIPMGRVKMAEYLCVDRSALTRELSKMAEDRIIEFEGNRFTLL